MPNSARASYEITLNGTEYAVRPSFEAIMNFQDKSGMDVFEALKDISEKKVFSARMIASAIWSGIKGEAEFQGRPCPSFNKIGEECQAHGFHECVLFAMEFLNKAVSSDSEVKKSERAQEEQTSQ